jgi:GntR family transcriptional regulator
VSELVSFTEEMAQRGSVAASRLLAVQIEEPPEPVREALRLEDGEKTIRVERLRLADGAPIALQTVYLPRNRFPDLEAHLRETMSLYRVLEEAFGVKLARAHEVYRPAALKRRAAAMLNVPSGSAAFDVERTTFDAESRPVEFVMSILRGDCFQLTLELVRR